MDNNETIAINGKTITIRLLFSVISVVSFAFPFLFGHNQIITGSVINGLLFIAAITLPTKYLFSIALFPSLAVLMRGWIFGPLTPFLVYFLPFIWIGNIVYGFFINKYMNKIGGLKTLVSASTIKAVFLYGCANIFFNVHLVPKIFLQSMGINQLITALLGGGIAMIIVRKGIYGNTK